MSIITGYDGGWVRVYNVHTDTRIASVRLIEGYENELRKIVEESDRYKVTIEATGKGEDRKYFAFKCASSRLVGRVAKEIATMNAISLSRFNPKPDA